MSEHWLLEDIVKAYFSLRPQDPCLCGSGRRFADCHQLSGQGPKVPLSKIQADFVKLYRTKCCYLQGTDCSDVFSASHSISRSFLNKIAADGHVRRFMSAANPKVWERMVEQTAEPLLIGINEASTFYGFCSHHDDAIFGPLEKQLIIPTREQASLMLFRALARELYVKTDAVRVLPTTQGIISSKPDNLYRQMMNIHSVQHYLGQYRSLRDLLNDQERVTAHIETADYSLYNCLTYIFDRALPIACSGYPNPPINLQGELVQNYNDLSMDTRSFALCVFTQQDRGYVCLSWDSAVGLEPFTSQLEQVPPERLADFLIQMVFAYTENHAIDPRWWSGLSDLKRRRLKRIFFEDITNQELVQNPVDTFRYLGFTEAKVIDVRKLG